MSWVVGTQETVSVQVDGESSASGTVTFTFRKDNGDYLQSDYSFSGAPYSFSAPFVNGEGYSYTFTSVPSSMGGFRIQIEAIHSVYGVIAFGYEDVVIANNTVPQTSSTIVNLTRTKFLFLMGMFGSFVNRQRLIKTTNSIGDITGLNFNNLSVSVILLNRFKSSKLNLPGMSTTDGIGKKPKAYCLFNADILPGDYLLIDYNSVDGSYSDKYLIEDHRIVEIGNETIYRQLFLRKEK